MIFNIRCLINEVMTTVMMWMIMIMMVQEIVAKLIQICHLNYQC